MLLELYIENFALVDKLRLSFENGLNILTGETGSGKSIIIDALNLALGDRFEKSFVRKGTKKGLVEAIFNIKNDKVYEELKEYGIDAEYDDNIIITREIYADGKSISRINGRNVKLSLLKHISSFLVDIHSQHENTVLLNKEKHLDFIDLYGDSKISKIKENYSSVYKKYVEYTNELEQLTEAKDEIEIQREIDLIKFQINEISECILEEEEYEGLVKQREINRNSQKIFTNLSDSYSFLYDSNINAFDLLSKALKDLKDIIKYDEKIEIHYNALEEMKYNLQDVCNEIRDYKDSMDFSSDDLIEIETKIDLVNNLKRKYGNSIGDIIEYKEKITARLDVIINRDEKISNLKNEIAKIKALLSEIADQLTDIRMNISLILEEKICEELYSLNMKSVNFKVNFEKKNDFTKNGIDSVEFLVSFNMGEDLKPMQRIASGGEMSRFMLAIKNILSDVDCVETLVLDEIDTGISGIAAQIVGEKLKVISQKNRSFASLICRK